MPRDSFVFTIFFLTLGPVKVIPAFARLTQSMDHRLKQEIALKGILIASLICCFVALLGRTMLENYRISLPALLIAGGLVLLLSALNTIFPRVQPSNPTPSNPTAIELAISPVATPIIVPPIGIAAILFFVMLVPQKPGSELTIAAALLLMLMLDFLVMFFIDRIVKLSGLMMMLQVFGAVLVFFQVALAIQAILSGLEGMISNSSFFAK